MAASVSKPFAGAKVREVLAAAQRRDGRTDVDKRKAITVFEL